MTYNNEQNLNTPLPAKLPSKRKKRGRACASTGGRKEDRRRFDKSPENSTKYKPRLVKLNRWYLDQDTGTPVKVSLKDEIPVGSRVVEQPSGAPCPSFPQFHDFSLLPKGSTLTASYSPVPRDEDPEMRNRFYTALKLMGVKLPLRRSMYDTLMLSGNPQVSLGHAVRMLCGQEGVEGPANKLTQDSLTLVADDLEKCIADSVNIGNAQSISTLSSTDFTAEIPSMLGHREEMATLSKINVIPGPKSTKKQKNEALSGLKESHAAREYAAAVVSIDYKNSRTELVLSCKNKWQVDTVCAALHQSGGTRIQWDSNAQRETIGSDFKRLVPVTDIYASFACSPAEVAHALGGTQPEVSYSIVGDLVYAAHSSSLYGETYTNPAVLCGPSLTAVSLILRSLQDDNLKNIAREYGKLASDPFSAMAEVVGPSSSVADVAVKLAALTLEDFVDLETLESMRNLPDVLETEKGHRHRVEWVAADAVTDIVVSPGTDASTHSGVFTTLGRGPTPTRYSSVDGLPSTIEGICGEQAPVKVLSVRFYKDENNTLVAASEQIDVSDAVDSQKKWLSKTETTQAVLAECEAAVLGLVSKTVLKGMRTPKSPNDDDRRSVAELAAKQGRNKFEPYSVEGGEMLLLVQVLATNDSDEVNKNWGYFCQVAVTDFYKKVGYERGSKKQNFGYPDIWSYLEDRGVLSDRSAQEFHRDLLAATQGMLSARADRQVTEEETLALAGALRGSLVSPSSREPGKSENGKLFHMGVDRGKAMHRNVDIPTPWY